MTKLHSFIGNFSTKFAISSTRFGVVSPKETFDRLYEAQSGSFYVSDPLTKNQFLCQPLLLEGVSIRGRFSILGLGFGGCLLRTLNPSSWEFVNLYKEKKKFIEGMMPISW